MLPVKLRENVYWTGGIDWDLRNFHGYLTQRGSTYNSYLIIDEKITLIDTVKHYLADEMLARISKIIDPSRIDIIISNHVEMDHSGSIPAVKKIAPRAKIYTSAPQGEKGLFRHFREKWEFIPVKTGDTLSIGSRTLAFIQAPMVHWPDNMAVYSSFDNILFSNDAFGQHYASSERFDDECPNDILMHEAKKYYANIVMPYGAQVQKVLEALKGIAPDMVAPSHGIVWRKNFTALLESYKKWSLYQNRKYACIVYDTMWHTTAKIAQVLEAAFAEKNIPVKMFNLQNTHISDIITEVLEAEYICLGSPTLNKNILPTMAAFLAYLKGLAPKNKKSLIFGSWGWGGESLKILEAAVQDCGFTVLGEPIGCQYIPDQEELSVMKEKILKSI
ncbi:MAG TPA: MBL fold metallo-hydrolase [Spirochaetia bacterium]|nr:MBL fold metallo-hydrolase [Spirochaetia bacterium]